MENRTTRGTAQRSGPTVIEIFYSDGCPHHAPALALVREVVAELGLAAEILEVRIETPEQAIEARFLGSPSIRVNGMDIEPEARGSEDFAIGCRVYGTSGVPPRELFVDAIRQAG
jgi:hypothetical protein